VLLGVDFTHARELLCCCLSALVSGCSRPPGF
jgi:hypothetical protein